MQKKEALRFEFYNERRKPVNTLNHMRETPPVLALLQINGQYTIFKYACDTYIGCIWLKEQEDKSLKPIGYLFRSPRDVKTRCDIAYKKRLSVKWAVRLLRPYLEQSHFIIRIDGQTLRCILDLEESDGRPAWQRLQIVELNFEIVHRSRLHHQVIDTIF